MTPQLAIKGRKRPLMCILDHDPISDPQSPLQRHAGAGAVCTRTAGTPITTTAACIASGRFAAQSLRQSQPTQLSHMMGRCPRLGIEGIVAKRAQAPPAAWLVYIHLRVSASSTVVCSLRPASARIPAKRRLLAAWARRHLPAAISSSSCSMDHEASAEEGGMRSRGLWVRSKDRA